MHEWWRPDRFALRRAMLEKRGRILAAVRSFFADRGFVEVDTPALQVSPGLEPHLRAFATELHDPQQGQAALRYLHTSPEFADEEAARRRDAFGSGNSLMSSATASGARHTTRNSRCSNGTAVEPPIAT